jgi:hypothetical protein
VKASYSAWFVLIKAHGLITFEDFIAKEISLLKSVVTAAGLKSDDYAACFEGASRIEDDRSTWILPPAS